jgi:hypothetical protein
MLTNTLLQEDDALELCEAVFNPIHVSNSQVDKPCLLCVRFFFADHSFTDQAIKMVVGPTVHVEVIIIDKNKPTICTVSFAAYVGSALSMYITPMQSLRDALVENMVFPISEKVANRLGDYYLRMHAEHVPYNWYDSRMLMPFWSPYTLDVIADVQEFPTHVFCSQMVILGMRQCMDPSDDQSLLGELHLLNSRLTSPGTLLHILRKFGRPMQAFELTHIVEQGFTASLANTFNA